MWYGHAVLKSDYQGQDCSIARTLEIVGERWTLLIVRDAFRGIRRFDDLQESLGISRNVLAERLARLVDEGVLERVRYQERPERFEYVLTAKGRELRVALAALRQWGDNHGGHRPTTRLQATADKRSVVAALIHEGDPHIAPEDVESVPV